MAVAARAGLAADQKLPFPAVQITADKWEPPTVTLEEAVAGLPAPSHGRTPLNIEEEHPTRTSIVLGAANTPGRFGAYYTTDVYFVNPNPTGQARLNVYVLRHATDNIANTAPARSFSLPARGWFVSKDIMGQMNVTGGATILVALDAAHSTGDSISFSTFAFTSTPGPDGGRYGVNIHAVGATFMDTVLDGWAIGVSVNEKSRTNLGVFNPSTTSSLTVSARVYTNTGQQVATIPITVPRCSFSQVAVGDYASSVEDGLAWFAEGDGPYMAYMVVNDNITNDANFQLATAR
jgi:hypothetical protein